MSHLYESIGACIKITENNHNTFKLDNNQKLMTEDEWYLEPESLNFIQHKKSLFIDTILKINNYKCPIFLVVGKKKIQIIHCNVHMIS